MALDPQNDTKEVTIERRGLRVYDENPSIVGRFPVAIRTKNQKGARQALMIAPDTGEVLGSGTFGFVMEEEVDSERFVKIYLDGIKQHGQLTKAGLTVFEFVYHEISGAKGRDRDTIALNHYIASKWKPDLSRGTYYRGVNELLEKAFLFHAPAADVYFINIRFLFNGDRMHVIRSYRRKGAPVQQELPLLGDAPDAE